MRGVTTYSTFLSVLEFAQKDPRWAPDAIVVTGDIVQDESRAGYERFREAMRPLSVPTFCIPGNHDDPELMAEVLDQSPFQVGGEASFGGWNVVFLSTFLRGQDAGALGTSDLTALEERLSQVGDRHTLVCMHHQPIPMGSAWLDGVGLKDAEKFLAVIDRHRHVRGVIWGHVHQASDRQIGNVRFLSTPSTCSQFLPGSDFFALDSRPPGLRWLELQPDGSIRTEVSWLE